MVNKILIVFLSFGFTFIILRSCVNDSSHNNSSINDVLLRDSLLIGKYHEQCLVQRGKTHFHIPKEDISSILKICCTDSVSLNDATKGDLVLFFDSLGNVVYQARIYTSVIDKTYVECLDLETYKYYVAKLDIDSIRDLEDYQNLSFKIFR